LPRWEILGGRGDERVGLGDDQRLESEVSEPG
jgi:hypothetical protein